MSSASLASLRSVRKARSLRSLDASSVLELKKETNESSY